MEVDVKDGAWLHVLAEWELGEALLRREEAWEGYFVTSETEQKVAFADKGRAGLRRLGPAAALIRRGLRAERRGIQMEPQLLVWGQKLALPQRGGVKCPILSGCAMWSVSRSVPM